MTPIEPDTKPLPEIPYRGIESFRYIDQRVFCAREEETWDLLSNILINRGVLLYGDSGSGKSSLINAGLIPAAIKENLYAHRLRVQPRRGREIKVERIAVERDDGPPYLRSDLVDPAATDDNALSFEISIDDFYKQLDRLRGRRVDEPRPLLIFDQFEEFITLFEEASQAGSERTSEGAPGIQENILTVLTSLLQDDGLPVKLLFVFREEYLAKLNILFRSAPELLDQYVRLRPPRIDEAEQIILAPFVDEELKEKFGGTSNRVSDLEGLAKRIATQIQQRSENGFINLTELQIVCRKLWESRDPARYFESNNSDIQKVLEGYWADALKKLGDLYDPSIALLGHMITSTNTRNIVSEPDLKFFEKDNFSEDQINKALNALVDSKLVRREPRHRIYFYEIVSEFLVPWIRDKKAARLAQIEANKLAAETRGKLKKVEKEKRYLLIGSLALGLLLVLAGFLSYKTYRLYQSQKATAEALDEEKKRRVAAEGALQTLSDLVTGQEQERLAAVKKLIDQDREGTLPRGFVPFIVTVIANDQSKDVTKAGVYFYDSLKELAEIQSSNSEQRVASFIVEAAEKNNVLAESQPSAKIAPRVYFQLASDNQRPRADKLAAALRSIRFTVPAYEIVGRRAPNSGQLRWYRPANDADLASTTGNRDNAIQKIREVDGPSWTVVELRSSSAVRPNHFELWFGSAGAATPTQTPTPSPTATATATPTPESSQNVALTLTFFNEQGKEIPVSKLQVVLRSSEAPSIGSSSNTVKAPPGMYILNVRAAGYKPYLARVVLKGSEVKLKVTLVPLPHNYQPQK